MKDIAEKGFRMQGTKRFSSTWRTYCSAVCLIALIILSGALLAVQSLASGKIKNQPKVQPATQTQASTRTNLVDNPDPKTELQLTAEAQAAAEAYLGRNPVSISRLGTFEKLTGEGYEHPFWNISGAKIVLRRMGVFAKGTLPVGIFVSPGTASIRLEVLSQDRIYLDYGGVE